MLSTVALINQLAQLAVQLVGQVGSSEHRGSVGVDTASTGDGPKQAGVSWLGC